MGELFQQTTFEDYDEWLDGLEARNPRLASAAKKLRRRSNRGEVLNDDSLSQRDYVEVVALGRRQGYYDGSGGGNVAAKRDTDRQYSPNAWRFVEEFLQNADDCEYLTEPSITIEVDQAAGQNPHIKFTYNETGFTRQDVWAITAFQESNKTDSLVTHQSESGIFYREKTGRKGRGFKSVFALQADNVIVHIRSNGFSFRLDNQIGCALPIWEDGQQDGWTHIDVELINPKFDLDEIISEFSHMFCIGDYGAMFARSPFLFMHRLRSINLKRREGDSTSECLIEYREEREATEYRDRFEADPQKTILAGIARDDGYFREQLQRGTIEVFADEVFGDSPERTIPIIRFTRMVEDEASYRNYSVIAPLITEAQGGGYEGGALFRTLPLPNHRIAMPLAIDAPFVLELHRGGIEYSPDENSAESAVPPNVWNTEVASNLFDSDGVLEAFLLSIREVDGIRMDRYVCKESVMLFDDATNRDSHGGDFVPRRDLNALFHSIPILRSFSDPVRYVSVSNATILNRDMLEWPCLDSLLPKLLRHGFEQRLVSPIYADGSTVKREVIEGSRLVDAVGVHLDDIEENLGLATAVRFSEEHLYPFLSSRQAGRYKIDRRLLERLRIFYATLQDGDSTIVIRESFADGSIWLHATGPGITSINRYRIFESSPANLEGIDSIVRDLWGHESIDQHFNADNLVSLTQGCVDWADARDTIEAACHFGYGAALIGLRIEALEKYVLGETLDPSFNPFRTASIAATIPDDDVDRIARYLEGGQADAVRLLKSLGLKDAGDYFTDTGNYLRLRDDAIALLSSDACDNQSLSHMRDEARGRHKLIDVTFAELCGCTDETLLFLLREGDSLLSVDSLRDLCKGIQKERSLGGRDGVTAELKIRAYDGSGLAIPNWNTQINIKLRQVLEHNLAGCIERLISRKRPVRIVVDNDGAFDRIPDDEMERLFTILGGSAQHRKCHFYVGYLTGHGTSRKYLKDRGWNVYLNRGDSGDYLEALGRVLNLKFDDSRLRYIDEMEQGYQHLKESLIDPAFADAGNDPSAAYDSLDARFDSMGKRDVIAVLSYFRYYGYAEALGNGNQNNEQTIAKDYERDPWRFVYEFVQNVDDCTFAVDEPRLHISTDEEAGTLTFEYNEVGFSTEDIKALTKFGRSNKVGALDDIEAPEGVFNRRKTGRKGIGFKSVFALPGEDIVVHIRSNGFSFKLSKSFGSIIPLWEDDPDLPETGTRITVEGFRDGYLPELERRLTEMIGLGDLPHLFSTCPVLFLRKLSRVSVGGDAGDYSISIRTTSREFAGKPMHLTPNDEAGIAHEGSLRQCLWEALEVEANTNGNVITFPAVRYSMMFELNKRREIASIFAPILSGNSTTAFRSGSIFRTLPLSDHSLSVPIAIDAPFEVSQDRSALEREHPTNNRIVNDQVPKLLKGLFFYLRGIENIQIGCFIPHQTENPFTRCKGLEKFSLRERIRDIPILRTYGSEGYVSCNDAIALPQECYAWQQPDLLCTNFEHDGKLLVDKTYAAQSVGISRIHLQKLDFVKNLNGYLDELRLPDADMTSLLREGIYPYIRGHFSELETKYRGEKRLEELLGLRIFTFEMYDGTTVRESAGDETVWMEEVPDGLLSFGRFRCIGQSSLAGREQDKEWYESLHEVTTYREAFTGNMIRTYSRDSRTWEETKELISSLLYYRATVGRLSILGDSVLSEELDPTENVFRDAFLDTHNSDIVSRVITSDDIEDIIDKAGLSQAMAAEEIAKRVKGFGTRKANDFFEDKGRGILYLNTASRAMLRSYCKDKKTAKTVLGAVKEALDEKKRANPSAHLLLPYEDLKGCTTPVFSTIFSEDILGRDELRRLARNFCAEYPACADVDYAEAYLRALSVAGTTPAPCSITIRLSEILARGLGQCVRTCKLKNLESLGLHFVNDVSASPHEVHAVNKALEWLNADMEADSRYRYFKADLSSAFQRSRPESRYLLDDDCVYLDAANTQGSMLSFVRDRYRKEDESFVTLLNIITAQNRLKTWDGPKKDFVEELKSFRENTRDQLRLLVPNYDQDIERATGNPKEYLLPELLQNINDCAPREDKEARDLFVDVDLDAGTMLLRYDERGFDFENVYSITALGQSSKHDASEGEKGLGFKKVFSVFERVEIYSNGFFFSLSRGSNTIPEWIADERRVKEFDISGKTTMLFHGDTGRRDDLKSLLALWEAITEGSLEDNGISPLFLHNIDTIQVKGCKKSYAREVLKERFAYVSRQLFPCFSDSLYEWSPAEADEVLDGLYDDIRSRKKLELMSNEDAKDYVFDLTVEICIPRKAGDAERRGGHLYSTLRTEREIPAGFHINTSLELTTGRNDFMEDSRHNMAVFEMLFRPVGTHPSVFVSMLEELSRENPDLFLGDCLSLSPESLVNWISQMGRIDREDVMRDLENAHLFKEYGTGTMQSVRWGYTIPDILWHYTKEVADREDDLCSWMRENSSEAEHRRLLSTKSLSAQRNLQRFANAVMPDSAHHPLRDPSRDYAMEYLSKEFSAIPGWTEEDERYEGQNPKHRFACRLLIPYIVSLSKGLTEPSELLPTLSPMRILPYKTAVGTCIGCIESPDVPWYFTRAADEKVASTAGFRVFDGTPLKDDALKGIKSFLIESGAASEYTDQVAIDGLVSEMAKEPGYTPRWWKLALEVFRIWSPEQHYVRLETATKGFRDNSFLFLDSHCPKDLRALLIRHRVFKDILTQEARSIFWDKLKGEGERTKATDMLGEMGVPYTFVTKGRAMASQAGGSSDSVNPSILNLAMQIAAQTDFAKQLNEFQKERCDLCHRLFFSHIAKESPGAFRDAVKRHEIADGIPILNSRGEYVPLSWDLFYVGTKPTNSLTAALEILGLASPQKKPQPVPYTGDYERLVVDTKRYDKTLMGALRSLHNLMTISKPYEEYRLGIASDASNFYKWVWNHSQHAELVDMILRHYSRSAAFGKNVPSDDGIFVLAVLESEWAKNDGYAFNVAIGAQEAFDHSGAVNRVAKEFNAIDVLVRDIDDDDRFESYFDARDTVLRNVEGTERLRIEQDPLWRHIYLADGIDGFHYGKYVRAKRTTGEDMLLLQKTDGVHSYISAIAQYIQDRYGITANAFSAFDCEAEYTSLASHIRRFLSQSTPKMDPNDMYQTTVDFQDINGFEEEKRIWQSLKEERDTIRSHGENVPRSLLGGKYYLDATYHGVCQLCHCRTPKGVQSGIFYTYRIAKPSMSPLADAKPNLFSLCATCHGALGWGWNMGMDLTPLVAMAEEYAQSLEETIASGIIQSYCVMEDYVDSETEYEWFTNPVICHVLVNGVEHDMAFSWRHFMRVAFLLSEMNDMVDDDDYDELWWED